MVKNVIDLHTHTTFSDGQATVDYLIEKATEGGYKTGVSDHLFCSGNETLESIERYLNGVQKYEIPIGGETNIGEGLPLKDSQLARFDYLIASVHAVFPKDIPPVILSRYFATRAHYRDSWEGYDQTRAEEFLELSYKQMVHYMENNRGEVLGHAGVMPFYDDLPNNSKEVIDWENSVVALCKKHGYAMEISGMWEAPFERILRKAKQEGLKFTFGSDCHRLEGVGNLKYCRNMAEKLELTDEDMFVPTHK